MAALLLTLPAFGPSRYAADAVTAAGPPTPPRTSLVPCEPAEGVASRCGTLTVF